MDSVQPEMAPTATLTTDAEPAVGQHARREDTAGAHAAGTRAEGAPRPGLVLRAQLALRLALGERDVTVETGIAAEFVTMTPNSFSAVGGPAELIMIFDRDGQHAHVYRDCPAL